MSASDINARLNVVCKELIEVYVEQKVPEETIAHLEELIDKREQYEFMELALGFRKTMAFLDHDEYTDKLTRGWHLLDEGMALESKAIRKKVQAVQGDSKADPEQVANVLAARDAVDEKKAKTKINELRLKAEQMCPINMFLDDPDFDAVAWYEEHKPKETWLNKVMGLDTLR